MPLLPGDLNKIQEEGVNRDKPILNVKGNV